MSASDSARTYGRGPSRLDPIAPDWLVRILAPKKAPIPWFDMVRSAVTITVPLAVGVALGQPGLGIFAAMGSLVGAFGDKGGPFVARLRRTSTGAVFALAGLLIGRAISQQGVLAVLSVAALAVVSALLSTISANLSFASLQMLVYVAVAGALPSAVPVPVIVAVFAAGMAWAVLLSFVQTRVDPPVDGTRLAEVGVLRDLAAVLRDPAGTQAEHPTTLHHRRRAITHDLSAAYDDLVAARATSAGRRGDLARLSAAMTATFAVVTALFDLLHRTRDADPDADDRLAPLMDRLTELAGTDDLRRVRAGANDLVPQIEAVGTAEPELASLTTAMAQVARSLAGKGADRSRARGERTPLTALLLGRKAWVFAARLAITLAVAETVRQLVPLEKPYWIVLTAALVLKPDLGSIFARGVQRTLGTLVGVVFGIAIVQLVPHGGWLLLPLAVLAFWFPFGASRNYGLLSTFITPLVLILLDSGTAVDRRLAVDRLLDTAIGAGIVLVVGYLCWPSTWRPRLGEHIAAGVEALGSYARVAFAADHGSIGPARRRTYRAMSDIRSELQSTLAEPPPLSSQAAAWWPLIAQLEKATDDLSDASFMARHHQARPGQEDVAQLVAGLDELAAALRAHRTPRTLSAPASPLLGDVAADIDGARRLAAGPVGA